MADESAQPAGDKLTAAELQSLVGHMTAGDFWRFTNQKGNQQAQTVMSALHRVATEQGLANGEAIDAFLDRVEIGELLKLIGGASPLVQASGAGSQISADIGD
jgi:hypothetical protein